MAASPSAIKLLVMLQIMLAWACRWNPLPRGPRVHGEPEYRTRIIKAGTYGVVTGHSMNGAVRLRHSQEFAPPRGTGATPGLMVEEAAT